jgi:hypothetical protein
VPRVQWSIWSSCLIAVASLHLFIAARALHHSDFDMVYATAVALRNGRPAYTSNMVTDGLWFNMNPPQLNLVTWPLALLPQSSAADLFRVVNLLACASAVLLTLPPDELLSARGGWIVAATIASPALVMQTGAGQIAGLLALLVAAAGRALRVGRQDGAAAMLGVLCALKPIFVPLLVWMLLARQWRALAVAAATGMGLVLAAVMIWGVQPQLDWIRALGAVTWFDSRFNMGWVALTARLLPWSLTTHVVAAMSLALGVPLAWAVRGLPWMPAMLPLLVGSIVAAPLGWLYYLCVPGPLLIRWAYDRGRWPMLAWLLWVPLPLVPGLPSPWWMRITLLSVYAWGMLALLASLLRERPALTIAMPRSSPAAIGRPPR